MNLDYILIGALLVFFVCALVTWIKFFGWFASLIFETNKRTRQHDPTSITGFSAVLTESKYGTAWLGFFKSFLFAALSFIACMATAFILMAPEQRLCGESYTNWRTNIVDRVMCVWTTREQWN